MSAPKLRRWLLSAVTSMAIGTSCAKAPPVSRPDLGVEVPSRWTAEFLGDGSVVPEGEPRGEWWVEFGDPRLSSLVVEALENNRSLRATAARIGSAAALARIAGADTMPQLGLSFDGAREKRNFIGLPVPGSDDVLVNRFTSLGVSLNVTWEIDVWGRIRAGQSASIAERQSAEADFAAAQLSLIGQTLKAWFAAIEAQRQVDLSEATLTSFRTTSEMVRSRYERGLRPSLDVRLADADAARAEGVLEERRRRLDSTRRQLEALLGRYPAGRLDTTGDLPPVPPPVPDGLPADLVSRRPDLAAFERRLAADRSRIRQARAALYPRFSLTTSGGSSSSELADLVDGDFSVWRLAGNMLQPVFQGGRLLAGIDLAEADAAESLALYVQAALNAYAEVESALAAESLLRRAESALREAVEQAVAARELAAERYARGLDRFITLQIAQRQAFEAESRLLDVRRLRLDNRVDLHLALGGGFRRAESGVASSSGDNEDDDPGKEPH